MPTEFGQQVLDAEGDFSTFDKMSIDGEPANEFLTGLQAGERELTPDPQSSQEALNLFVSNTPSGRLFGNLTELEDSNTSSRFDTAHVEAFVSGSGDTMTRFDSAMDGTKTPLSEVANFMYDTYSDDIVDQGTLEGLLEMPAEEQIKRIGYEASRREAHDYSSRMSVLVGAVLAGQGSIPIEQFDEGLRNMSSSEVSDYKGLLVRRQGERLQKAAEGIIAATSLGSTGNAVAQIVLQDFIPVFAPLSRSAITTSLADAIGVDLAWYQKALPGEARQAVREALAEATPDQRLDMINQIAGKVKELKDGPLGPIITEYALLENLTNLYTPEMMQDNVPANQLDRWTDNIAQAMEAVYMGMLVRAGRKVLGGRGVEELFEANNTSSVRQVADATADSRLMSQLDDNLRSTANQFDIDPVESAVNDLPRTPSMRDELTVQPDGVKTVLDTGERLTSEIMRTSGHLTGEGLTKVDKSTAIHKEIADMDAVHADAHVNHRMLVLEGLEDGSGARVTSHLGATPDRGWSTLDEAAEMLTELDPDLIGGLKVMYRNADNKLSEVKMSPQEFARLRVTGEVPKSFRGVQPPASEASTFFKGKKLSEASDAEVLAMSTKATPEELVVLEREYARRAEGAHLRPDSETELVNGDVLKTYQGDDFYIRMSSDHFWRPDDKLAFNDNLQGLSRFLPKFLLPPNWRWGKQLYEPFAKAYLREQQLASQFEDLARPFQKLGPEDKRLVATLFEWSEDFAKNHSRLPTASEIALDFGPMTPKQVAGHAALQDALNTMWQLFNRRLYRDSASKGHVTARAVGHDGPRFHGESVPREAYSGRGVTLYDPSPSSTSAKQTQLSGSQVEDLYNSGGGIIKVEIPLDVPGAPKVKLRNVLVRPEEYRLGTLSTTVLDYHPGYFPRFHEDPFYIIKTTAGVSVDGSSKLRVHEEAIRTAGTTGEGERFIRRINKSNSDPDVTYKVQRARDIAQTDGNLFQLQSLNREGRLFWDKRNFERLPSVNGNRAELMDPIRSLEKSFAMGLRQTTMEDLHKTFKNAFGASYKDKLNLSDIELNTTSIDEIIATLVKKRANSASTAEKKLIQEALGVAKYLRLQQGAGDPLITAYRSFISDRAAWAGNLIDKKGFKDGSLMFSAARGLERWAHVTNPIQSAKSIAHNSFIVLQPIRQRALQTMQSSMLFGLRPTHFLSGQFWRDKNGLMRGLRALRDQGYKDGWKVKHFAEDMGFSTKEYKRVVEEFDRSGLIPTVNVHTHVSGGKNAVTTSLPKSDGVMGHIGYRTKQLSKGALQGAQRIGFDRGESNNLAVTYGLALRRKMEALNVKSPTKLSRQDWDDLAVESSNLALAMIRPNNQAYQAGMLGLTSQFMSFSYKAAMTLLGKNPAIQGRDRVKMALGIYALYGANIIGADEWARHQLEAIGADKWMNEVIGSGGETILSVLTGGMVETSFNALADVLIEDSQDLDMGFLAPGANLLQIWEMTIEAAVDDPYKVALGPFEHQWSALWDTVDFATKIVVGNPDIAPADKFTMVADNLLKGGLPVYNQINQAGVAFSLDEWRNQAGDPLPFKPSIEAIIAKGVLGVNSEEAMSFYSLMREKRHNEEQFRDIVGANRTFLKKLFTRYHEGEYGREFVEDQINVLRNLANHWPEAQQLEIFRASLLQPGGEDAKSVVQVLVEMAQKGQLGQDYIGEIRKIKDLPPDVAAQIETMLRDIERSKVSTGNQLISDKAE